MTNGDKAEIMTRLKDQFKLAMGDVDVRYLGDNAANIAQQLTAAPTDDFTSKVQAGLVGEEGAERADKVITEFVDQILDTADEETLDAMAQLTADELDEILRSALAG